MSFLQKTNFSNFGEPIGSLCTTTEQQAASSTLPRSYADNRYIDTDIVQAGPNQSIYTEFKETGSLFSIHSAPPVPSADHDSIKNTSIIGFETDDFDVPRRPATLAIDGSLSTKTIAAIPTTFNNSEIEEDENENLLTVSSLTARPLIAKSRELRSNKHSQNFRNKKEFPAAGTIEPLDGGYGWFVVFGAFSVQFWVPGLVKSYGVLFVEILETFPSNSTAVASWIPAILSALCLALAPISSALCQRFSCRSVVFVGGLFCTFGLTLSYFATSIYHLLFTFGILTGIGGGLSTTPGIIIVSLYFDKHRALANGICVSGTAAGSFVFPVLIEHLVKRFGFHGTILILGVCMLHVCISAALYRPIEMNNTSTSSSGSSTINTTTVTTLTSMNTINNTKSPECISRSINDMGMNTTSASCIGSVDDQINKKYIEHMFLEESKNRINDYYSTNKFVNTNEKAIPIDSDDEDKDIIGESKFLKPSKSIRSASILHSVEDLSTDSTCVYKSRSGFDSNRGSRKRNNKNAFSTDEILAKIPLNNVNNNNQEQNYQHHIQNSQQYPHHIDHHYNHQYPYNNQSSIQMSANRGLSKSMIIPTPVSDFSEYDEITKIKKRRSCCEKINRYLDVTLLKDPKFIAMCLSVTLMSTGCPYLLYFLPAFAITTGYTKSEAGFLVTVSAALDLIGRLGCGYLSDLQIFDHRKAYTFSIIGAGFAVLIIPFANSWYIIGSASATYGLCLGSWYLLMPVLLADMFGTERISSSYGLVRMFQSVGAISVPPFAGFLKDFTGGYEICFYGMGTCMVLGSLPLLIYSIIYETNESTNDESEVSTVS